jgi:hypothetical protein
MPFGLHLAMDALPSGKLRGSAPGPPWLVSSFRLRARLGFSIPASSFRPARRYPRVSIWRSSFERQRDFNPPEQCAAQRTLRPFPPSGLALILSMSLEVRPPPAPDLPQLLRPPFLHAVLTTPVDRTGAGRLSLARSRAGLLPCPCSLPRSTGGSASTTSLSRPAQASLALRPARLQPAQGGLLSRGSDLASYLTKPLGSYHAYRQLHGWILLPLVICAVGAHC